MSPDPISNYEGLDRTTVEAIASSPVVVLPDEYVVARLAAPPQPGEYLAVVDDGHEVTVIATAGSDLLAEVDRAEGPFYALQLRVSVPFGAPGFIAAATGALASEGLNVFVVSTYSFDYLLIRVGSLREALAALQARGFPVNP